MSVYFNQLPILHLLIRSPEKMTLTFAFQQGLRNPMDHTRWKNNLDLKAFGGL